MSASIKPVNKPLVSIITPFYNSARFLEEAISSVLAQTYGNWELLLIDDGSQDASTALSKRYVQAYPEKIRYLEHAGHGNLGACAARNLGLRNATGSFIALLDSDDVWMDTKLDQQLAILNANASAGMVYGSPRYWVSWDNNMENGRKDYQPGVAVPSGTVVDPPNLLRLSYPLGNAPAPTPSDILLRRQIVEEVGGFEEQFAGPYQMFEDQAFLVKLYTKTPAYVSDECWLKYRQHPDSCCSKVVESGKFDTVREFFFRWLGEYLAQEKIGDQEIHRALKRCLWQYRHPTLQRLLSATIAPMRAMRNRLQ